VRLAPRVLRRGLLPRQQGRRRGRRVRHGGGRVRRARPRPDRLRARGSGKTRLGPVVDRERSAGAGVLCEFAAASWVMWDKASNRYSLIYK
jgi:hypothetical protein